LKKEHKGSQNLIPFSRCAEDVQREIRSKGGRAKAQKQREIARMREIANTLLNMPVKSQTVKEKMTA
jgi:hypothetical protein